MTFPDIERAFNNAATNSTIEALQRTYHLGGGERAMIAEWGFVSLCAGYPGRRPTQESNQEGFLSVQ